MDTTSLSAFVRACEQLSADIQATIDWADDTDFRMSVRPRELLSALLLPRQSLADSDLEN
jgi:hypothetical protein